MSKINKLYDFIDEKYFVQNLRDNKIGHIKLAFLRETTSPMVIRSTDPEATITLQTSDGRELIEIPPRKLKSREKLLGLQVCRKFGVVAIEKKNDKGSVIEYGVRYNSIFEKNHLANPNSVLFGDSVTQSGSEAAALPSKVVYDWAYSLRSTEENIVDKLQHNSINEEGTIIKKKDVDKNGDNSVASQSLHQTEYVLPGTLFPHFLTVDNVTPELFYHLLICVLNQNRYGAMTNINGVTMTNHLVGIAFGDFEKPVNSFMVSKAWHVKRKASEAEIAVNADPEEEDFPRPILPDLASVASLIQDEMKALYGEKNCLTVDQLKGLTKWVNEEWDNESAKGFYEKAKVDCLQYLKDLKIWKEASKGSTRKGGKKNDELQAENPASETDFNQNDEDEDLPTPD